MTVQINTGEVVISYKDIKLSLWINTETQYDNIKFAQLFFCSITMLSLPANRKLSLFNVKQYLNCTFFC